MRTFPILLILFVLLAACAPLPPTVPEAATPSATAVTGIEGQVSLGPTCPVQTLQDPCPDHPYQATLSVLTLDGAQVTQFQTDANGHFLVPLAPGTYVLHPEVPAGKAYPRGRDQNFTVVEGRCTQLVVTYDSGIR